MDCFTRVTEPQKPLPPIRIPVAAENRQMIESWHKSMQPYMRCWNILDFDPQYQVFWVELAPPIANDQIGYAAEIGYDCYYHLKRMRAEKLTNWQFPCLQSNRKPIRENPLPPQFLYEDVELDFRFWNEKKDLDLFLNKFSSYYNNSDEPGQWCSFTCFHKEFNPDLGYDGAWVYTVGNYYIPISAGILFEMGVSLAHAHDTNFWNLPPPLPEPGAYCLQDIAGMQKQLEIWKQLPENTFERGKNIAKLSQHILNRKLVESAQSLKKLSTRRPLLAREQVELSFLEKIQAADSFDALDTLNNELTNTATDPELKARLQKYVVDKMAFY